MRALLLALALSVAAGVAAGAGTSPPPAPRPTPQAAGMSAPAAETRPTPARREAARAASLCGDPRLKGRRLGRIGGGGGCGIADPIALTAVGGVRLEPAATLNCDAARAVADWVEATVVPASLGHKGSGVVALEVAASYACRRVNHRPGGKLSQHAKGNAIDITGFRLADGRRIALPDAWRGEGSGLMRAAWQGACGPFGTVLGPESDRWHRDHVHLDIARYRSGPYCR